MKKKQKPSVSQYAYMTGTILNSWIQKGYGIDNKVIEQAVEYADHALTKIYEILNQNNEGDEEPEPEKEAFIIDYFADYPWNGEPARYTDLDKWLRKTLETHSNRRVSNIFKAAYEEGLIRKDPKTGKYLHHSIP